MAIQFQASASLRARGARAGAGTAQADPFMAFRFQVAVGSAHGTQVIGGFSDVTGLTAESDVETLRVGGVNATETMLAGATKYPSRLVLKRGLGASGGLWNWYQKIMSGVIARENVTVRLVSADGQGWLSWTFLQACPVKWTGPELHAATSAVSFETVELIHKGLLLPSSP